MDDYNDFYMRSIASGAQPDEFGGVHHTTASMMQMQMNQDHQDFANHYNMNSNRHVFDHTPRHTAGQGFWGWFFGK